MRMSTDMRSSVRFCACTTSTAYSVPCGSGARGAVVAVAVVVAVVVVVVVVVSAVAA